MFLRKTFRPCSICMSQLTKLTVETIKIPDRNMINSSLLKRDPKGLLNNSIFKILLADEHIP